tara:strand:- start:44 stop:316 length:273 start_codon:yes stop_codon:yes gene_type:complete
MSTPFKMKGFSGFGNSPMKDTKSKKKQEVKTTFSDDMSTLTKTQGDRSSTYKRTSSTTVRSGQHKGGTAVTYENELGNKETRIFDTPKKS